LLKLRPRFQDLGTANTATVRPRLQMNKILLISGVYL